MIENLPKEITYKKLHSFDFGDIEANNITNQDKN